MSSQDWIVAKNAIVKCVTDLNGCKATELAVKIFEKVQQECHRSQDLIELLGAHFDTMLSELIFEEQLVELEYCLPEMPYRIKSFLLPRKTIILKSPKQTPRGTNV